MFYKNIFHINLELIECKNNYEINCEYLYGIV